MNRLTLVVVAAVALMLSCKGGRSGEAEATADTLAADTVSADTASADSLSKLIAEAPMPKAADELFDDFLFNFAANKRLQLSRIQFPLPIVTPTGTDTLRRHEWVMDRFFMRQGYYTLIFDTRSQASLAKDTTINEATVEKISLTRGQVRNYCFRRTRGLWRMRCIEEMPLRDHPEADFLQFYRRFAADSLYQAESLAEYVDFSGPDPDDDFARMDGLLTAETWPAFAPQLPRQTVYNIIYGGRQVRSKTKIFVIRGISNGFEIEMVFSKDHGRWLLHKLTT